MCARKLLVPTAIFCAGLAGCGSNDSTASVQAAGSGGSLSVGGAGGAAQTGGTGGSNAAGGSAGSSAGTGGAAQTGGTGGSNAAGGSAGSSAGTGGAPSWWKPAPGLSWQWDLSDSPAPLTHDADIYDIDLFDNDASVVDALHAQGRKAICYVNVGSWENWRPDAGDFPSSVLGKDYDGWAGEKWLDIRAIDALAPVIGARMDLCRQKGFDGLEPDNIDGYQNDTGFALTAADQLAYNQWLADQAHARRLSIGLKNDSDQVADLQPHFDWALTEDCFDQGWCADLSPFVAHGKAVLMCEYTDTGVVFADACQQAATLQFSAILKHRQLDDWLQSCP